MNIFVTDRNGNERQIEVRPNVRIMELIRNAGLPIRGECGGSCVCATCHVFVDNEWLPRLPAPLEIEVEVLAALNHSRSNSRPSDYAIQTSPLLCVGGHFIFLRNKFVLLKASAD